MMGSFTQGFQQQFASTTLCVSPECYRLHIQNYSVSLLWCVCVVQLSGLCPERCRLSCHAWGDDEKQSV